MMSTVRLENWSAWHCQGQIRLIGQATGHAKFEPGEVICTSPVQATEVGPQLVITRNTLYQLGKPAQEDAEFLRRQAGCFRMRDWELLDWHLEGSAPAINSGRNSATHYLIPAAIFLQLPEAAAQLVSASEEPRAAQAKALVEELVSVGVPFRDTFGPFRNTDTFGPDMSNEAPAALHVEPKCQTVLHVPQPEQGREIERLRAQMAEGERLAAEVRMAVLGLIHDIRHRPELPNGLTETYVLTLMWRLEAALGTAQTGARGE